LIEEYALADNFRLEDRAIWCTDRPSLEAASAAFRRPDSGHRNSPWFKTARPESPTWLRVNGPPHDGGKQQSSGPRIRSSA